MSGMGTSVRRFIYKVRHDFFAVENVFLVAAIVLCLVLTYQSIMAMSRNWELSERLGAERKQLELLEIEAETSQLENDYYRTEEYQELLARKYLDKQLPGENMVVLPKNTDAARNKHRVEQKVVVEKTLSNFEKWMIYLFPDY